MPKAEKIWSGILVGIWVLLRTFLLLLTAWAVFFEAIFFVDRMPKTVDSAESGEYTLLLQTLGSPGWPFGPQDGRIVLKKGGRTICRKNFTLHNDGKNMTPGNWSVSFQSGFVLVTISGEEQGDEVLMLKYDK